MEKLHFHYTAMDARKSAQAARARRNCLEERMRVCLNHDRYSSLRRQTRRGKELCNSI